MRPRLRESGTALAGIAAMKFGMRRETGIFHDSHRQYTDIHSLWRNPVLGTITILSTAAYFIFHTVGTLLCAVKEYYFQHTIRYLASVF